MSSPETKRLLLAADDPVEWEYPATFDWERSKTRVRDLVPALEAIVGRPLEMDEGVQDASYFTEVVCYRETRLPDGGVVLVVSTGVRFSSFGDLFTVIPADHPDPAMVGRLVATVSAAGFTCVPADELGEAYDGANPGMAGMTWWIRFFDYL